MRTVTDFIWRVRCAFWFVRRLHLGPFGWDWAWQLSGVQLQAEQEIRTRHGDPFPPPVDSVDEELACWGD